METCLICKKEFPEDQIVPCIKADGTYAPLCVDCNESWFARECE